MKTLANKVAVVAGATRGCGRALAQALGAQGATVYCTGRSAHGHAATAGRPETLEETVALVEAAGGRGVLVQVDHTVPAQVEALAQQVRREAGRLDVLVNDVWGGDALTQWGTPFWQADLTQVLTLLERGLASHLITSRLLAPLLVEGKAGLLVEVGDGEGPWYRGNLPYDLVKAAVLRLAFAQAVELRPHGVTAVAVTPGFLRSEAMLTHFGVTEATWREAIAKDPHSAQSETPHYLARGVAALAGDPQAHTLTGRALTSAFLARRYGFTDVDGRSPDWPGYFAQHFQDLMAVRPVEAG
jgi:NAD(P)-dependent dehydrogenase (short-subunit alcohol dehydrogenase family)